MTQVHRSLLAAPLPWPDGTIATLGLDPGDTCGLFLACWFPLKPGEARRRTACSAFSCDGLSAPGLAALLLGQYSRFLSCAQAEEFVIRGRSGKLSGTVPGMTAELLDVLTSMCAARLVPVKRVNASAAKAWATDERLAKAGFLEAASKMKDARDASRHALFCAVKNCGLPDPLSKRTPKLSDFKPEPDTKDIDPLW